MFDNIKGVRGMSGYGWFANAIFNDKDEPKKQYAIDFWFKPDGDEAHADGRPRAEGPEARRRQLFFGPAVPVAWWWLPVRSIPAIRKSCAAGT